MSETIIVAIISLFGTLGGSLIGVLASNKLTNYRIEQLEKKVEKHNNLVERTYQLEEDYKVEEVNGNWVRVPTGWICLDGYTEEV